jgi:hypothetical protein
MYGPSPDPAEMREHASAGSREQATRPNPQESKPNSQDLGGQQGTPPELVMPGEPITSNQMMDGSTHLAPFTIGEKLR